MPPPFQRLTVEQFAEVLNTFDFQRRITSVHMHHTWRPNHAQWRGHDSMVGMWRFHTQERGFSDIAQHLTIDPEGQVWTGRNWNASPASAAGHNGTSMAGPFMFEMVGDFDRGRDRLAGAQRTAVLDVIALVQRRFGLPPESLMFHNQAAHKSCPGTSIAYEEFVAELRVHAGSARLTGLADGHAAARRGARGLPLPPGALAGDALVDRTVRSIAAGPAAGDEASAGVDELDYDAATEAAILGGPSRPGSRGGGGVGADLTPEQIDALRPFVLNLRMGQYSNEGLMTSGPDDVQRIVGEGLESAAKVAFEHHKPLRIVLYAHGGLVKESRGLAIAMRHVAWWRDNGVYPIHFVWETGFFETLRSLLERTRSPSGQRGIGDWISDRLSDPLIEAGVRALQGGRIWGAMKASAQLASAPGGAAADFAAVLAAFVEANKHSGNPVSIELHAVGHSAGSIFQAHLLPALQRAGLPGVKTLQLMAPAVRVDVFGKLLGPLLGGYVEQLAVYTMKRDYERSDDCAKVYRKSLLYLVSNACENGDAVPLLGLEDSLRADAGMRALFGLGQHPSPHATVVWSKSPTDQGRSASRAVRHGDFDEDEPTMNSIARRVLGLADADPVPTPFGSGRSRGGSGGADPWFEGPDWPEELLQAQTWSGVTASGPVAGGAGPMMSPPYSRPPLQQPGAGRRRALCIGIDNYRDAPLSGCQADARLWQETFSRLGFTTQILLDPDRAALVRAIEDFFAGARSGDELVLQYAGHGTHVDDLNGDETDDQDEALCPIDYADGALFLDDDLGALIDRIAAGARLTLFMDCCHSGTNTRMGVGGRSQRGGARARFIKPTPALQAAHRRWRSEHGASRQVRGDHRQEVSFAACQDDELAWESAGHGEFTLRAVRILGESGGRLPPRQLHAQIVAAFGAAPRQRPMLRGPDARLDGVLFDPQA